MRSHEDIEKVMDSYGSTVWRVCMTFFKSEQDSQDAFQDTFLKYALADDMTFNDDSHCKAWLIKVASNICKDMLRAMYRGEVPLEDATESIEPVSHDASSQPESDYRDVLDAFRGLDDPPRLPLYLSLYEGYTAPEIADMLDASVNTVYSWIFRGKKALKEALS